MFLDLKRRIDYIPLIDKAVGKIKGIPYPESADPKIYDNRRVRKLLLKELAGLQAAFCHNELKI